MNKLIKEKLFSFLDDAPNIQPITKKQKLIQSISNANKRMSKQLETQGYANFLKGMVNINLNQLNLGENFLKMSLEKSFNIKESLWQRGRVYFFKRDFKNAAIFIQNAIDEGIQATDTVYTLLANFFFNSKNFSAAELNFQKAIDFFPSNYINYLNYGKALFFQNRFSHALNEFEKANRLFPKNVDILLGVASSSLRVEKNKKALKTFKIILQIDPKNTPAQKGLEYLKTKKAR